MTLRFLTAGESHGPALMGVLEGMPAGVAVTPADLEAQLARRRLGHGRSPRMQFEVDKFEILGGVRHGRTLGSPIGIVIHNTEWPKWTAAMAVEPPEDPEAVAASGRGAPLTRPRPGHADLAGMQKYRFDDARDVLERASARETAARVALAVFARQLLSELGIDIVSHVVRIGAETVPDTVGLPAPSEQERIDEDPVRCADPSTSAKMQAHIDATKAENDTLGGVVEVLVYGLPPGLGSHVHWDRKLDGLLAHALMSVQSVKAVEVGDGLASAAVPGSQAHDEIEAGWDGIRRRTHRAGGIEGGMSTGEVLRVRAAMKPISSLTRPLSTVDTASGEPAVAITQRSDTCAVPRGGVVLEAVVAHTICQALLEKTGGDHLDEVRRNLGAYIADVVERMPHRA